jgi:pimeloyl-ACP methyl ester carboxylesterase
VFVRDLGLEQAPPLVMLHGFRRCGLTFLPQFETLSRHFRLIIPDLPGHGESPPGDKSVTICDMLAAIDAVYGHFRLNQADLLGHSMGGVVAGRYALAHPSRVRSLIFLESLPLVAVWIQPDKVRRSRDHFVGRRLDRYITKKNSLQYEEEMYQGISEDLRPQNVIEVFTLADLRILLILNRCKRNPAAYYVRKIEEELGRIGRRPAAEYELAMIDEGGHFVHWTAARKVNSAVIAFLKGKGSRR